MGQPEIIALDWQVDQPVDEKTLTTWETQSGYQLPEDYRQFLLKYNGGAVRPWIFRHDHPGIDEDDHEAILDYLHGWRAALKYSELSTARHLATQPPDHLLIGQDPGGGGILMSLGKENHGRIVYWQRVHLLWGDEPNNVLGFIAPSFTQFLAGLFVDDAETEHGYWDVLIRKRAAKPLVL